MKTRPIVWWLCGVEAEEEYQIEKGRLMQEQRAGVSQVYEKKKSQNELLRKVWELDSSLYDWHRTMRMLLQGVCLSIRLSVTSRYYVETAKHIKHRRAVTQFWFFRTESYDIIPTATP